MISTSQTPELPAAKAMTHGVHAAHFVPFAREAWPSQVAYAPNQALALLVQSLNGRVTAHGDQFLAKCLFQNVRAFAANQRQVVAGRWSPLAWYR